MSYFRGRLTPDRSSHMVNKSSPFESLTMIGKNLHATRRPTEERFMNPRPFAAGGRSPSCVGGWGGAARLPPPRAFGRVSRSGRAVRALSVSHARRIRAYSDFH